MINLEEVVIKLNNNVESTEGIILSEIYIVVTTNKQVLAINNGDFHVFPDIYISEESKNAGNSTVRIKNLNPVYSIQGYAPIVTNEVHITIPTNGNTEVDTNEKRKNLIIQKLSNLLSIDIDKFE